MRNLGIGGEPTLHTKITEVEFFLEHIRQHEKEVAECRRWLECAQKHLKVKIFWLFTPYSGYDRIYQSLHQIRHILCQVSPPLDLLSVIEDIRDCLSYISDQDTRNKSKSDLINHERCLRALVVGDNGDKSLTLLSLEQIRYRLEQLSRFGAGQRDTHWRKVNLLRTRLIVMSCLITVLLLCLLFLVPFLFNNTDVHWQFILAVILFGALGGLVSALSTIEPLAATSSGYYLSRILLFLKPIIGAAGGLIVYLLQLSHVIQVASATFNPPATYLTTAFLAGFSERFFTSQLQNLSGVGTQKKQGQEEKQQDDRVTK